MTERRRIGPALLLLALWGLPPGHVLAGPWNGHFYASGDRPGGRFSPLDSLPGSDFPPGWVLTQPGAFLPGSPTNRITSVSLNPAQGTVRESYRQADVELGEPLVSNITGYNDLVTRRTQRKLWRALTQSSRSVPRTTAARGGLFRVDLPVQLPKPIRAIVGDGAPNLEVSGSETITLGGQSEWIVRKSGFEAERPRQSAFPSLEMKQDLQVNLTGSIGDKIKVDVDQSSNVTTSLDNKVKLRYEGDENDMVKSVELGNTNLSLAGASFRQEGLFGVKSVMKLGTVDLTTIASRQEGKSETARFTPSGEARQVQIQDLSYIPRRYFFLADHPIAWDRNSLYLFKDDRVTVTNRARGLARLDPRDLPDPITNPEVTGYFTPLVFGQDYDIITPYLTDTAGVEIPVIKLRYSLGANEVLAVAYVDRTSGAAEAVGQPDSLANPLLGKEAGQLLLKMIKPDIEKFDRGPDGRFANDSPWYPALGYELRNFYDLNARNIAVETLNLVIRRRDYGQAVDPEKIEGVSLLELLGLDQRDRSGGFTPDGRIDDNFINEDEGVIFFPDLHPFDPDTTATATAGCDTTSGFYGFLCLDNLHRNRLREQQGPYEANPYVYYFRNSNISTDSRFYIDAQFKSSQQGYYLGRFNLLENSEQVKVDGILQRRGTDYNLDYDTGQLTFLRPPGPDQVITVDYSFAPGVGQVQRTLLGFSSSYNPSQNFTLSSSMLYESRGASEQNPKLGEEPARSVIGDLSSVGTIRPQFMTDLANLIPGVRTNQQSTLNLQGGISMSMPNPNTQGEAYLDDMEGNKETTAISLGRTLWMWSSVPFVDSLGSKASPAPADHGLIQWYNARGVKERDLKPVLTNEEGGDGERTVLEINVKPNSVAGSTVFTSGTWTGLTQAVSRLGDDYSKLRYVEIWVNDRTQSHALTSGILHIDFGTVDEDAFWDPRAAPDDSLDSEDKNVDRKLDVKPYEDTGLDGLRSEEEPGFDPSTNPDPSGDDYHYDSGSTDYSRINGTEKSGLSDVNSRPDTEDLNLNNYLDRDNNFFEASIDLKDTAYVAIDVAKLYAGNPAVKADNGWRLFRIPIASNAFRRQGSPNWDNIKHVRLWLSGLEGNASGNFNIQVGGIELVGNRWLRQPITDSARVARGVDLDVRSRNNKDDAGIYVAPYDVENAPGGKATRREQSLALAYARLQAGDSVFAFRTVSDGGQGLGYTQYREMRFYVHGDPGVETQNLRLIARLGADTVSYYEYSLPVVSGWRPVVIPMEVLSRLKDAPPDTVRVKTQSGENGVQYTVVGRPSFTRVNRITFGLTVAAGAPGEANGEVWVDELRLADVRRDPGTTGNFVVQANFADVLALNGSFQTQDADFFRVGTGVNRGSGFNHKAWGLSTTFNLDRMLPQSGLQIPVRYAFQRTTDVPKYRIGSDVVLGGTRADIETSRSNRQSIDVSYRRSGPRRGWTRFTADALSGSMTYTRSGSITPQSADSTWSFASGLNYDLPIGGGRGIGLSRRMRLKYLPENISLGTNWTSSRVASYARHIDLGDSSTLRSNNLVRQLDLNGSLSYVPLSSVTLRGGLTSRRNMLLHREGPFGWNKGTETGHTQRLELSWVPRWIVFLNPNLTMSGVYQETGGPEQRVSEKDPLHVKNISNQANARLTTNIPLSRLAGKLSRPSSARDTTGSLLTGSIRYVLGRLQDISTTFNFDRSTTISRVTGNPGFAFKSGFTQVFDPGLARLANSNIQSNRRYGASANTGLKPLPSMSIDVRADQSLAYTDAVFGSRRTYSLSWPDVTVRWLELQRPLGLTNEASSLALNSHYSLKVDESGPLGQPVQRRLETMSWSPLLGWQASWKNGLRTDVKTAYTKTSDIDETVFGVTRTRSSTNHDILLTKLFSAARGIKFPWSKTRVRLPNDLNLNLQVTIQSLKQETINPYGFSTVDQDQQTLSVTSGTSYNFTQSVTGGFQLGFGQDKNNKSDIITRRINVSFNAQFRF